MLLNLADGAHNDFDELVDVDVGGRQRVVHVVADRQHLVEHHHDELAVAGAVFADTLAVYALEVELRQVGERRKHHAGVAQELVAQRRLVAERLFVHYQVLAGDEDRVHEAAVLNGGERFLELGDDGRGQRRVVGGGPAGGRGDAAQRRQVQGKVGGVEARR